MKKSSLIVSLAGVAALMLPFGVLADSHEGAMDQGPITDIWYVVPKRGMEAQFTEAMQAHMAFRADAGETWTSTSITTITTSNASTGRIVIGRTGKSMARSTA